MGESLESLAEMCMMPQIFGDVFRKIDTE